MCTEKRHQGSLLANYWFRSVATWLNSGLMPSVCVVRCSHTPGHALQVGVRRKLSAHLSICRSTGTDFIPLVAETLGEDTIRTVAAIGRAIGHRSGSPDPSSTSKHLFGRLAIALWRGNACLWLHRHPSLLPSLDGIV